MSLACEAMKRWASSVSDISSENRATGLPYLTAAFSAMLVTSADLPIDGRAAMHDQVAGLEAAGELVEVLEARTGVPVTSRPSREISLEPVELLVQDVVDRPQVARVLVVSDLEQRRLRLLHELGGIAREGQDVAPGSSRGAYRAGARMSAWSLTMRA